MEKSSTPEPVLPQLDNADNKRYRDIGEKLLTVAQRQGQFDDLQTMATQRQHAGDTLAAQMY